MVSAPTAGASGGGTHMSPPTAQLILSAQEQFPETTL